MSDDARCTSCGAPLPGGKTGTCLACVLEIGLHVDDDAETPPGPEVGHDAATEGGSPEAVGPYRILRTLGEGGMGTVYLAEQTEPIRREVALKVVKRGMDTRRVVERFRAERQALALMDHPAIASVHDAGATPGGRPYFVMEYVDGEPITEYCDRRRLTVRERLELLARVCDGVQHAHQKGIIHRDLKPSNVLVTEVDGAAAPKIIDFGVAKAVEKRLTEETVVTELGFLLGTPEYMSPEQAEMSALDVDTRTDVYSLGVLLYELMTGALPFDPKELRRAGFDEIRRKIREDEPPRPSARLGTLPDSRASAEHRRVDLPALRRALTGDLDWIAARALEKDRARRYGSPAELAADIERHLRSEPVLACPPSTAYRLGKFVRRNRLLVASLAVVFLGLTAGVAVATAFGLSEAEQRRAADRARNDLEKVAAFQSRMLAQVNAPEMGQRLVDDLRERGVTARGRAGASDGDAAAAAASFDAFLEGVNTTDAALRVIDEEILARAAATLEEEFADQPLVEARLRDTIGQTYGNLGLLDRAEPQLRRTIALREAELGPDDPDTLAVQDHLAILFARQGRFPDAIPLFRNTLEGLRNTLGDDHENVLRSIHNLALAYKLVGDHDAAVPLFVEVIDRKERRYGRDHASTLMSIGGLADIYTVEGRYDEAESLQREIVEGYRVAYGDDDARTLGHIHNLARIHFFRKEYRESEALYLEVLEGRRRLLGDEHFDTLSTLNNLAAICVNEGRHDEAAAYLDELLPVSRRALGEDHPATLESTLLRVDVLLAAGHVDEAAALESDVLEARRRVLGPAHPATVASLRRLAAIRGRQGRSEEAAALRDEAAVAEDDPRAE